MIDFFMNTFMVFCGLALIAIFAFGVIVVVDSLSYERTHFDCGQKIPQDFLVNNYPKPICKSGKWIPDPNNGPWYLCSCNKNNECDEAN